jgi:hypothetical protein
MTTAEASEAETQEEKEGPLFTNSYDLLNTIQDDVNTLEHKCNNDVKSIGDVVMFWDKSKLDLFKISVELELLKLLLQKGR